jgi:peptidoglycan-N-acetylglucosamine deacetylase
MNATTSKLTLTFDNGPDSAVTLQVLSTLQELGLTAIFFPVGQRLETPDHLELMHRAGNEGHRIGSHTYSHPRPFGSLNTEQAIWEIDRTDELLGNLCEPDRLFRPSAGGGIQQPGVLSQAIVDHLVKTRHTLVMWNSICEDWRRGDGSWVDIALKDIADRDHALLVLHDIASGAMDHLPRFLDQVVASGTQITTELPNEEVPIRNGEIVGSVAHLI